MTNHDILFASFTRVRETGLLDSAVINISGPAVGLDTDQNVDLCHFQRACNITYFIIISVCSFAAYFSSARSHRGNTGVEAACLNIVVRIPKSNAGQRVAIKQTFNGNLIGQSCRHRQCLSVIQLNEAISGNGSLLLIDKGKSQTVIDDFCGDLVVAARRIAGGAFALNRSIKLPANDWGTGKREGIADLQSRRSRIGNRIAVHVDVVDRYLSVLVTGVVEYDDVVIRICGKDELLLSSIGIERDAIKFGMSRIQRSIVNRSCRLNDRRHIAFNGYRLGFRNCNLTARILGWIEDVLHRVGGLIGFRHIYDVDDVLAINAAERQRLAGSHRAITGDGNRVLGDFVANLEVGVGHGLACGHRCAVPIDIVDRVAQYSMGPMSIDRGIGCNLGIPVEERIAVRRGVPTVKDVAFLCWRSRVRCLLIFLYGLRIKERRGAVIVHKADRKGRRDPLGIKTHVVGRHRREDVRVTA